MSGPRITYRELTDEEKASMEPWPEFKPGSVIEMDNPRTFPALWPKRDETPVCRNCGLPTGDDPTDVCYGEPIPKWRYEKAQRILNVEED